MRLKHLSLAIILIVGKSVHAADATGAETGFSNETSPQQQTEIKQEDKLLHQKKVSDDQILLDQLSRDVNTSIPSAKTNKAAKDGQMPKEVEAYLHQSNTSSVYRSESGMGAKDPKKAMDAMRITTIETTALSFGAQAGLKWRYDQINALLKDKWQGKLDTVSFRPFMTKENILMPSILITKKEENFVSPTKLVTSSISFVIADEARIVSVPPTFRDYLIKYYPEPTKLHPALQPKTNEEQESWKKGLLRGWDLGVRQANDIFKDGLLRFERDLSGRVNYLNMLRLHMVEEPTLKVNTKAVTFNGRTMNVGETVMEISDPTNYTNMEEWRSAWLKSAEFIK